jgi:hypothetical protein
MEEGGSKKELMFFLGSILYLQGRFSVGTSSCYFLTDFAGRQQFLPVTFYGFRWFIWWSCTSRYGNVYFGSFLFDVGNEETGREYGFCECSSVVEGLDRMHVIFSAGACAGTHMALSKTRGLGVWHAGSDFSIFGKKRDFDSYRK